MSEHRMLDFVRALVVAEPELAMPSVAPVRFQVRTGMVAPPKEQMRNTNYKVLVWKYRVKNLKDFSAFLLVGATVLWSRQASAFILIAEASQ
jgi:hypothetical protein